MMNLGNYTEVKSKLYAEGIRAEEVTVTKNGIRCEGLALASVVDSDSTVQPVVYPESGFESIEEFAEYCKKVLVSSRPSAAVVERMASWSYVRDHVVLALERKSGDPSAVARPYLNLDLCLRVVIDMGNGSTGSVKMTWGMIDDLDVPEQDVWDAATDNVRKHAVVRRLSSMLGVEETDDGFNDFMYVATVERSLPCGASVLAVPEIFRSYCAIHNEVACIVLPSSTAEVIIVPWSVGSAFDMDELAGMVHEINVQQVDPVMQLDPVVYRYDLTSDSVHIAASAELPF